MIRSRPFLSLFLFAAAISLLVLVSFTAGVLFSHRLLAPGTLSGRGQEQELGVVWEAWHILQEEFVNRDALDPQKMKAAAIKGIISSLGDPHTAYLDPAHFQAEQSGLRGAFDGIGAQVTISEGRPTIIAPLVNSPAERAGIRPGDQILEVDGQATARMSLTEVV